MSKEVSAADDLRRIILNAASLLFAYGLPRVFTAGSVVLAARVLGNEEFGNYGMAAALAVIMSILATLGMLPLLVREMAREPDRAPELMRSAHLVKTMSNAVMLPALLILARYGLGYSEPVVTAALLLGLAYGVGAYAENLAAYYQAMERMHIWTQASALFGLVTGALGAYLIWSSSSMVLFCAAPVVGQMASLGWLLFRAPAGVRWGHRARVGQVRGLMAELVPFAAAFVALTVYYKVDVLLLAHWRSPAEVGDYTAAYKFWDIAQALSLVGIAAVYPLLSRVAPRAETRGRWAASRVMELTLLVTVPLAALLWLAREPVVLTLFGDAYVRSVPVVGWLAPAFPALAVNLLAGYVLGASDRMRYVAPLYVLGIAVNVLLNTWLIAASGAVGAAGAKLISEVMLAMGFLVLMRIRAGASPGLRPLILAGAAAGLCVAVSRVPDPSGGLLQALGYAVLVAVLYRFGRVLSPAERSTLREAVLPDEESDSGRRPPYGAEGSA